MEGSDYMATIISFINLKGGVGKTTLTVNIGATLAKHHDKRVLLVDLDPQTNATVSVISQEHWQERSLSKQTIFNMFNDYLYSTEDFNIRDAIIPGVSEIDNLDLLPSSLELIEIQDDIPKVSNPYVNSVDVLGNCLSLIKEEYDYILIDCPPNLGIITLNGITISDYYIVPTIPDILSKIGIKLILNRIEKFQTKKKTCAIKLAGIVFTKVEGRTNLHRQTMHDLRNSDLSSDILKNELLQRIAISEAPGDSRPFINAPSAKRKNDWMEINQYFVEITNEILTRVI